MPIARLSGFLAEGCYRREDTSYVDVCPVDCIHPTADEPGWTTITPEDQVPPGWRRFVELNATCDAATKTE